MAMVQGSVSIADDKTVTGTGWAKLFWDDYTPKLGLPPGAPVASLRGIADLVNSMATVIGYIQANAHAKIETAAAGLQRIPASATVGTPTDGPSAEVLLPIA